MSIIRVGVWVERVNSTRYPECNGRQGLVIDASTTGRVYIHWTHYLGNLRQCPYKGWLKISKKELKVIAPVADNSIQLTQDAAVDMYHIR